MVLGSSVLVAGGLDLNFVILPLLIAASGILVSIMGTFMVSVKEGGDPQKGLNQGEFGSGIIMVAVIYLLIIKFLPENYVQQGVSSAASDVYKRQYVGSIIGSMVLGSSILVAGGLDLNFVILPLLIACLLYTSPSPRDRG